MQFKVVGKRLILTDCSHEVTEGENLYDEVEIILPRYHDSADNSLLSYRLTVVSENGARAAATILSMKSCTEKNIVLTDRLNENFSAVTGNVTFILTCIDADGVVGKFSSIPFTINNDLSLASLPDVNIAEQILNQTQLEAEKAIKASKTPAPAKIYPATTEQLGGVKVDGKTITASDDGTISASDDISKNSALTVQIAHPNNFLIYDDAGKPSAMVAIPKFYLDEVISGANHTVHPAFIINGVEQNVIYISKYQNIVEDDRAYSLPMKDPAVNVNFDQAWNYCKNKGAGWHLMTNAEWAAVALWCKKNGTLPKGNNTYGKDTTESNLPQKAIAANAGADGKTNRTLTGGGRESWYHDNTYAGISDLNGNVWEWCSGLRLNNGEIQILANNDAADWNNLCSSDSTLWKAIMPNGSLVNPGTTGTLKWDFKSSNLAQYTESFELTSELNNQQSICGLKPFGSLTVKTGISVPESLKALALFPADSNGYENDAFWIRNNGEKIPMRGGRMDRGAGAGIFELHLANPRTDYSDYLGFRCAFYSNNS